MLVTGWPRQKLKLIRDNVRSWQFKHVPSGLYYRALSRQFDREERAVHAGIRRHHALVAQGTEPFELRRRIHMLEKGLSMRPRRSTFATDYIEMVVKRYRSGLEGGALDDDTRFWIHDVLNEYFKATKESENPSIVTARHLFASLDSAPGEKFRGPELVNWTEPSTKIEAFEQLVHLRQTVRWFTDVRVPRGDVDRAIAAGIESPTACNRVPYRFDLYDSPSEARKIAAIAGGTVGYVHNLQGLIVVLGDQSAYPTERDRHLIYIDASLAIMATLLAMRTQGIGTCCINWPDQREPERELRRLIGFQEHERVVMLIAFGYPDPDGLVPGSGKRALGSVRRWKTLPAENL